MPTQPTQLLDQRGCSAPHSFTHEAEGAHRCLIRVDPRAHQCDTTKAAWRVLHPSSAPVHHARRVDVEHLAGDVHLLANQVNHLVLPVRVLRRETGYKVGWRNEGARAKAGPPPGMANLHAGSEGSRSWKAGTTNPALVCHPCHTDPASTEGVVWRSAVLKKA